MTIKKGELETLYLLTKGTEGQLNLAESRTRDAFMRPLLAATQTFEAERRAIYEKFCKKNEDGTPDVAENLYVFPPDVLEDVQSELKTLYFEDASVPVTMPEALKNVLERSAYSPKIGEAEVIDSLLARI